MFEGYLHIRFTSKVVSYVIQHRSSQFWRAEWMLLQLHVLSSRSKVYYFMSCSFWGKSDKKMEPGSFQWCPVPDQKGTGHKLEYKRFLLNIRKQSFYCECYQALAYVSYRYYRVSFLGDLQKLHGHSPRQPTLGVPAWAGGLDQI